MTNLHDLIRRMADELDHYRQLLCDDRTDRHALATEARAALAEPPDNGDVTTAEEIFAIATHGPHKGCPTPKPCPFCGSTNLRFEFAGSQGYICCDDCDTQGPCDERAADPICDIDAAYLAWNRRALQVASKRMQDLALQPLTSLTTEHHD
jgi:hypothetical protein